MAENQGVKCKGHTARMDRKHKIDKLLTEEGKLDLPDEDKTVLIKKGPSISVETSLKDLEEIYKKQPEWDLVENGGVLSVPVEELRMTSFPKPDLNGIVNFGAKKAGENHIHNHPVGQTVENLNAEILAKYTQVRENAKATGKSEKESVQKAKLEATKLSKFQAVRAWEDINAEIKLKKVLETMMQRLKVPALIIRSIKMSEISVLKDFGLKIPKDGEIDLVMAYSCGDLLKVVIFEVKRADTYPWQTRPSPVNKQAVNKAEKQLEGDVDTMLALLAGIPTDQICLHTLSCFPDSPKSVLKEMFCNDCLEKSVIGQEDLNDLSHLQTKTGVEGNPATSTETGQGHLLKLAARCLSHLSLLHLGYRSLNDKKMVVAAKHEHNTMSVDQKLMRKEFVIASPKQQEALRLFSSGLSRPHLVLEGPAGSGKTLVAIQAAKSLLSELLATSANSKDGPLLVVTAGPSLEEVTKEHPIMTLLDSCTSDVPTERIVRPYLDLASSLSAAGVCLATFCDALAKRWAGRDIVLVVDEIILVEWAHFFSNLDNISGTNSIRLILVLNPRFSTTMDEFYDEFNGPKALLVKQKCKCDAARKSKALDPPQQRSIFQDLPEESFQRVSLQTSYRSTKSIIKLARHLSKCLKITFATQNSDSDSDELGSDLEGTKPMFFDTGRCDPSDFQSSILRLRYALDRAEKELGSEATILYNISGYAELQKMVKMTSRKEGGPWQCYKAAEFYGCEADKVFLFSSI